MSAYRFFDPNPVMWDLLAVAAAANGTLTFCTLGTTDEKDTFSDPDLEVEHLNPNPVPLDSDGRANVQIWLDGEYSVILKDVDGNVIWTRDLLPIIAPGLAIPSLSGNVGAFLTNDGTNLIWQLILLLPDPTDSAGYYVTVNGDGTGYTLTEGPADPDPPIEPDIEITATSTIVGDGTLRKRFLTGSAAGVNAGGRVQSVDLDFPADSFSAAPKVFPVLTNAGNLSISGNQPSPKVTGITTDGCTVSWTMGEIDDDRSEFDFNAAVTFDYLAVGLCAAEEEE